MYTGVRKIFAEYWRAYGGAAALFRSPYLHAAVVFTVATYKLWALPGWWDTVISVLPNLLGFTLGGFAIFMGFGDEKFRNQLASPDDERPDLPTTYVSLCATFVHFIVVQVIALIFAVLAKAWGFYFDGWPMWVRELLPYANFIGGAIGFTLFVYAITSILAATMHVFRIANMYAVHRSFQDD